MIQDNPANRLLNILTEGKNFPTTTICKEVWKSLLDVKHGTESLLTSRLGKTMELPEQIISELHKIDETETDDYTYWTTQVNKAFMQQNLNDSWDTFINYIDLHTLRYLKISKQLISAHAKYQEITDDKLAEMREKIEELIQEVRDSDLEIDIQSYLLSALAKIHISIIEYKITGYLPVMDSIDSTIGHAVINTDFIDKVNKSSVGKKLWGTLQVLSVTIGIATGVPQLPEASDAIMKLLKL